VGSKWGGDFRAGKLKNASLRVLGRIDRKKGGPSDGSRNSSDGKAGFKRKA